MSPFFGTGPILALTALVVTTGIFTCFKLWSQYCWQRAAHKLGLKASGFALFSGVSLFGVIGNIRINIKGAGRLFGSKKKLEIRLEPIDNPIPFSLSRSESNSLWRSASNLTGDTTFDRFVSLGSDTKEGAAGCAIFDQTTRQQFRRMCGGWNQVTIEEGALVLRGSHDLRRMHNVIHAVQGLTSVVQRLSIREEEVALRLRQNIETESNPDVRRECFKRLVDLAPTGKHTMDAARSMLFNDQNEELVMMAARYLGKNAIGRVIVCLEAGTTSASFHIQAAQFLAQHADNSMAHRMVLSLLGSNSPEVVASAMDGLVTGGHVGKVISRFRKMNLKAMDARILASLAQRVSSVEHPEVEALLVDFLAIPQYMVQDAALDSLSTVGSRLSVQPLLAFRDNRAVIKTLRDKAKYTIRDIQGRMVGVYAGGLAIHEGDGQQGSLSLDMESGALSTVAEAKPRTTAKHKPNTAHNVSAAIELEEPPEEEVETSLETEAEQELMNDEVSVS